MDHEKSNITKLENISDMWREFAAKYYETKTFALFYAANKCFLGLVDKAGNIEVKDNKDKFDIEKIFEARIFNKKAELRWLKGFDQEIITDELYESDEKFVEKQYQNYLLWGEKIKESQSGDWTKFGTARIGTFSVPVEAEKVKNYAQFTAVEYLKEFEDGNIAVWDERLTGIEEVK